MVKKWRLVLLFYVYQLSDAQHPDLCRVSEIGPTTDVNDGSAYLFKDAQHPDLCQDATIDAITRVKDGSTYVFKGFSYWKILQTGGFESGYPRYIFEDWDGLPSFLDASLTVFGDTYFFKDNLLTRFTNRSKHNGDYPRSITKVFENAPYFMDAALLWGGNDKIYFFKGDKYIDIDSQDPSPIEEWSSKLEGGIDAAFQWENGKTYFFKGDKYYRYDDDTEEISDNNPPYPLSTAIFWFNCPYT